MSSSPNIFWFIPTHGDSRYLGTSQGARPVDADYLKQVAVAADTLGYDGVLLPTGRSCEDAWVVASSLIAVTQKLKFLVAIRPGLSSPGLSVRMASTFDRLSNGRLLINVVTGGDQGELEADGVFADHAKRYEISDEFFRIWRATMAGEGGAAGYDFEGKHLQVKGAKTLYPPVQQPYPPLYFGGSSEPAHELAAAQMDTYLTWGEPPAAVAEKLNDIRTRAAKYGRTLKFGIRLHVIVRETNEAAWRAAEDLISHLDDEVIAAAQKAFAKMDSVGQQRSTAGGATSWKCRPICGRASAWCGAVPARPWWAIRRRWRRASGSMPTWASRPLFCPATRTWKSPTGLRSWCFPCSARASTEASNR